LTQSVSDPKQTNLTELENTTPKKLQNFLTLIDKSAIIILGLIVITYFIFITLPVASIFLNLDPTQIGTQLQNWQVINAIQLSLYTSAIAALLAFTLAVPSAYFMATRGFPGKTILDTILDLPIVLPPAVAGIALLYAFAPKGILGPTLTQLGITIPGFTIAVILAQAFVASPFLFRAAKTGFENQNRDIYNSARILSGSQIHVFFTVSLPLNMRNIISGTLMAWTRAMGEFGATLMFAGNLPGETATMPLTIYTLLYSNQTGAILLSIILIALSFTVLVIVKLLEQKRFGAKK
jgi:molybdate transport system permease protein